MQGERGLEPAIGGGRDHRAFPGPDSVERREPLGAGAQHHPGEVVALEHQGLLDRAGRGDVGAGPDLMQRAAAPDRHEPVEPADRGRRREDLHPGPRNPRGQLLGLAGHIAGENRSTQLGAVVDENDIGAQLGGLQRGRHARDAASDHQNVGVAAAVLGVPLPLRLLLRQLAEPCGVPQDPLVERPQTPGPDEGLVVEAGRREPAPDQVGGPHRVELQRGARVHVPDVHPLPHGLGACPDSGPAVHLDQAVRALARAAEQPAGPVVLEAARDRPPPGGMERRADRVALVRLDALAVELEADRPAAVDSLVGAGRKPVAHSGSPTQLTSLVVVSRSATNQARHPDRWYHHSRWTPARLRRK